MERTNDNISFGSLLRQNVCAIIVAFHDLYVGVSRCESVWCLAKQDCYVVFRVGSHQRVEHRATDITRTTSAAMVSIVIALRSRNNVQENFRSHFIEAGLFL